MAVPDTDDAAREACLRLLAARPRSRQELAGRLAQRGSPPTVVERVLDRLTEVALVDDAAFARTWVSNRHAYSGRARRALAAELRAKGVADDVTQQALLQIDDDDERARATELVRRKLRTATVPDDDAGRAAVARRLLGFLARRGYPAGLASDVVATELD